AEQKRDALADLVGDIAAALDDRGKVWPRALDDDAELFRALRVLENLGALEQRLRRNAAPVEADAAELRALHACGLEAELCAPDRGDIPARTRTDHDDVESHGQRIPRMVAGYDTRVRGVVT